MTERPQTYLFGPLERRGLLGPLRAGQAIAVGGSLLAATVLIDLFPSAVGAVAALVAVALSVALTTIPLGARTAEEWLPVAARFATRVAAGRRLHRSQLPLAGARLQGGRLLDPEPRLPPTLRGVELRALGERGPRVGALAELGGRRLTGVLACRAPSFALLDPAAQERRLTLWGAVLSGLAGTPTRRLQWLERTAPAESDELARWLEEARDPSSPARGAPIVDSYLELISAGTRVSHAHEVLIAVQVQSTRARNGAQRLEKTLIEQLDRIARALETAEIRVLGALGAGQLARAVRTAFDPFAAPDLRAGAAGGGATGGERHGIALHEAAPLTTREAWDHYRSDRAHHATFWISSWPRVEVTPMFLDPVLGSSRMVRTLAVTFEPVAPERSAREVEAAITRDRADSELRRRFGQSETARQHQAQAAARRRESELAAGHGEVRLSGFVTVSGRSEQELRLSCDELLQQSARARLGLHRLYGQQAEAFTFTLPLARGLR